jgi:hypothetical protein
MQRAKAGMGIIFLIVGAIVFATLMEDKLNAKFSDEPETQAEQINGS